MKRTRILVLGALIASMLACNVSSSLTEEQVATFSAETIEAINAAGALPSVEIPTEAPVVPSDTPVPGTATPVPPTPTAGTAGCTDLAGFVSDVTIPDDSPIDAGDGFVKTWRLRNNGTCTWTSSYSLVFDHGDQMGGPDAQSLPGAVAPGNTVDLSVNLTAPNSPGTYQGYWLLRNNTNVLFGLAGNQPFFVKIKVPGPPTATATATSVVFNPGIIISIVPLLFTSHGTGASLGNGSCFDLDAGAGIACSNGAADMKFIYALGGFPPVFTNEIDPSNGAKFRYFGGLSSTPSGSDCQAAALSGGSFTPNPATYCYRTSSGKYGYLRINTGLPVLGFDWATYSLP
jgi:hypothetical protein